MKEVLTSLIPGRIYYKPFYQANWILANYDFMITEETSVEVSMLGNLWLLGGAKIVFLGGAGLAMLHGLFIFIVRRAWRKSELKGFLFLGLFSNTLLGAAGLDIIAHWRAMVWRLIFAFVIFLVLGLLSGELGGRASGGEPEHYGEGYGGEAEFQEGISDGGLSHESV